VDHQAAVVAPVRRLPGLAVGHQGVEVALERVEVQFFDFLAVVEVLDDGVGLAVVLVQDVEVQRLGSPVHDFCAGGIAAVHYRTFAGRYYFVHCPDLLVLAVRNR
jgi:hypothetical protein